MRRLGNLVSLIGLACLGVATFLAWQAIGTLVDNASAAVTQTEQSLLTARNLAGSTANLAERLDESMDSLDEGLASTADAVHDTAAVSAGLRDVISFLGQLSGSVEGLVGDLQAAEQSLLEVEADLRASKSVFESSRPVVANAIRAINDVPRQLDDSIAQARATREDIDRQQRTWRLALVLGAVALASVIVRQFSSGRSAVGTRTS